MLIRRRATLAAFTLAIVCQTAVAGVEDWEVNEVVVSGGGDTAVRYIELKNLPGGCLFPSSRVTSYDADGQVIDTQALVAGTTCYGADTYYLLATTAAKTFFATDADVSIAPLIPAASAQICFTSSSTRYDCVRWGSITTPVVDFFGAGDTSVTAGPADAQALERRTTTHVIADDWALDTPTPRGPNDGTPWTPPDAGPTPDAFPPPDAGPDAGPEPDAQLLPDARPVADASDQEFLDLTAGGGAACSCASDMNASGNLLAVLAVSLLISRRSKGRSRRTGPRYHRRDATARGPRDVGEVSPALGR